MLPLLAADPLTLHDVLTSPLLYVFLAILGTIALFELAGLRYIPNNRVGVVEKLWSPKGSVGEGRIIALNGEAGYQADVLRGGFHFGYWRWQFRIHKLPLVTVPQGQIGYVYSRDGEPLAASQTLARVAPSNNFQDAKAFLNGTQIEGGETVLGQRGRQRAFLREGVYAINPALFVVITANAVYRLPGTTGQEMEAILHWQNELVEADGFGPVMIGEQVEVTDPLHPETTMKVDSIGIVTVHDGPSLPPGEIIAPAVGTDRADANYHNNYQDPEAFLRCRWSPRPAVCAADRRHLFHQPLVCHRRVDAEDRGADRLCRRGRQLLRPAGPRSVGRRFPPRRARRRGRTRRVGKAARAGQIPVQHLCRQHHAGADDELRAALDHRQDRRRIAMTKV